MIKTRTTVLGYDVVFTYYFGFNDRSRNLQNDENRQYLTGKKKKIKPRLNQTSNSWLHSNGANETWWALWNPRTSRGRCFPESLWNLPFNLLRTRELDTSKRGLRNVPGGPFETVLNTRLTTRRRSSVTSRGLPGSSRRESFANCTPTRTHVYATCNKIPREHDKPYFIVVDWTRHRGRTVHEVRAGDTLQQRPVVRTLDILGLPRRYVIGFHNACDENGAKNK